MSAKTLEADAQGTLDVVTANGQRIQLDGNTNYKIRRPGFVINYNSDIKSRKFMYDGKNFTVYSPKLGYYATAPAPGTNREVLDTIYNKFGSRSRLRTCSGGATAVPTQLGSSHSNRLTRLGPSLWTACRQTISLSGKAMSTGRSGSIGPQPLPRKLVIVDRSDPARPTLPVGFDGR